jgi:hypothetical protein
MHNPLLSRLFSLALFAFLPISLVSAHTDLCGLKQKRAGNVTKADFSQTLRSFKRVFASYSEREGRELEFFSDWNEDWAQAFARRWETDQVIVYGGIARINGSTVDSFALILCHELGHLYAGEPFSDSHNRMAVEGQADWWATMECWEKIIPELPLREGSTTERGFVASLIVASFFAENRNLPAPRIETPDQTIVNVINRTHPEPQCRLDTFVAGLRQESRPLCWFTAAAE